MLTLEFLYGFLTGAVGVSIFAFFYSKLIAKRAATEIAKAEALKQQVTAHVAATLNIPTPPKV